MERASGMCLSLLLGVAFVVSPGCGAGVRHDQPAETASAPTSAPPPSNPGRAQATEPGRAAVNFGQCSLGCCSEEMLALQEATARRLGDPTIATECCFCDDDAE